MRVCVVGAGANGLACAKALIDQGMEVTVFEQLDNIGGLWKYNADPTGFSPCYETLTTNTPKRLTAFQDFPMPDAFPLYPHHSQMFSYLESYAAQFNLMSRIYFNTTVTNISRTTEYWTVTHKNNGIDPKTTRDTFDAVAVCTGHHWKEQKVKIQNSHLFKGSILHSRHHRKSSIWKGKTVLIEGLGVSGREILLDILPVAKQIIACSSRNVFELPEDVLSKIKCCKSIKRFVGDKKIEFIDGTTINDVDAIISCRGYLIHVPFLDINEFCNFDDSKQVMELYQRIISPIDPRLAFIGFVTTYGSLHPIAEIQAKYFASTLTGTCTIPSQSEMEEEICEWRRGIDEAYRPMNVDYWDYIRKIDKLLPKKKHSSVKSLNEINCQSTPENVKVASIQAPSILGDVKGNTKRFSELIKQAAGEGAKFIVLPEAAIPGYVSQDLTKCWHIKGRKLAISPTETQSEDLQTNQRQFLPVENLEQIAEPIPGPTTNYFSALAKQLGVYLVIPLIEKVARENKFDADASFFPSFPWIFYNSCVLLSPGGDLVGSYRKNNLWGCVDNAWCTAGSETCIFDTEYGRVGLAICFDVHIMFERYKKENIWCLLYPIAWVDRDIETWFGIDLPRRVADCGYHVVGSNWSIDNPSLGSTWKGYGHSTIYKNDGSILATAKNLCGSEIIYAKLPVGPTQKKEILSDYSTDLMSVIGEPDWTRRSKTTKQRFENEFLIDVETECGVRSIGLYQGGDAEHLGMTVWDGGIVLGKYFEFLSQKRPNSLE